MKLKRFVGLFAMSYFLLIFAYILAATIIALYEHFPDQNRVLVLWGLLRDSALSIFRDSTRWVLGSEGLYSFIPTLMLMNSTDVFRSLSPHVVVQLVTFGFIGGIAAARGCSLTMTLVVPVSLIGLTVSLLESRLLFLHHLTVGNIGIVVASQITGIFLGSMLFTSRLR